ncbi:DUF2946 family protein [Aquabacterium sp.]|uniref:DUF2946 family protein n=1 Tax=Aquabacterium sp. TaxID=1872578 RepID=UPI00262B82CF|nr:DUF2946 family protein [Aquabacterium sp.]MDD2977144.1 DUF2946 family protein [Aquabacterium sp.]
MDDIVKAAIKKWPNVPYCYGWLALDARGDWYLRDEPTQAAGPFPQLKGSLIQHDKLKAFIHRNYAADERGAWYFQNGPQRVYLQLELAPLVLGVRRLNVGEAGAGAAAGFEVQAHTGQDVGAVQSCWLDEMGRLYLLTEAGLGVVRSMDMDAAADAVASGVWGEPQDVAFADMPARFGFVREPVPAAG